MAEFEDEVVPLEKVEFAFTTGTRDFEAGSAVAQ